MTLAKILAIYKNKCINLLKKDLYTRMYGKSIV